MTTNSGRGPKSRLPARSPRPATSPPASNGSASADLSTAGTTLRPPHAQPCASARSPRAATQPQPTSATTTKPVLESLLARTTERQRPIFEDELYEAFGAKETQQKLLVITDAAGPSRRGGLHRTARRPSHRLRGVRQLINRHIRYTTGQTPNPGQFSRTAAEIRRAADLARAQEHATELLVAWREGADPPRLARTFGLRVRCLRQAIREIAARMTTGHPRRHFTGLLPCRLVHRQSESGLIPPAPVLPCRAPPRVRRSCLVPSYLSASVKEGRLAVSGFLAQKRREIIAALLAAADECHHLEIAVAALDRLPSSRASAAKQTRATRTACRRASGRLRRRLAGRSDRAQAATWRAAQGRRHTLPRGNWRDRSQAAAITIPELAARVGIKQNYLYRVMRALEPRKATHGGKDAAGTQHNDGGLLGKLMSPARVMSPHPYLSARCAVGA